MARGWGNELRPGSAITVLIVDAQRLFAEALAESLGQSPGLAVLDEFPVTGVDALMALETHRPDAVVLDYWMVDADGPPLTRAILARRPTTAVVILSWLVGRVQVREALSAGASAFLLKNAAVRDVVDALWAAMAGERLVYGVRSSGPTEAIGRPAAEVDRVAEVLSTLTVREIKVLQLLAGGMSPGLVAKRLGISTGTVKNHVQRILRKTGSANLLEAIAMTRYARLLRDAGPPAPPP